MAERPDLREIASSLREAIGGLERDALVDVLTYVLNEYVVEGPPPLAPAQIEKLEDLAGLTLGQLVAALQTRLETPGLELFRVEPGSEEVRVQTAGGWVALQPGRAPAAGAPQPGAVTSASAQTASAPTTPASIQGRAGARFVEQPMSAPAASTGRAAADEALARGRGDLVGGERGAAAPTAPRPRGLSVSGRPAGGATQWNPPQAQPTPRPPPGTSSTAGAAAQPPTQPPPEQPDPAAQPGDKPTRDEDDATIRFSLLELD
jgi:hypothetical protein